MEKTKSICIEVIYLIFFTITSLDAQICFDSYNNENCPYRIVSEFSVTKQVNPFMDQDSKSEVALNLGIQKGLEDDLSIGLHWFFNFVPNGDRSSFHMGLRPRIAFQLSPEFEASLSPGIIVTNSIDNLEKFKGFSFESNISWKNKFGLVLRVDKHNLINQQSETVVNLGLQTYGSTSFYSIGGVALGAIIFKLILGSFVFF